MIAWGRTGRVALEPSPGTPSVHRVLVDGRFVASVAPAVPSSPCPDAHWFVWTSTSHKRCCLSLDDAVMFALRFEHPDVWRLEEWRATPAGAAT